MKAAVLYGNEDIRYADWETPAVKPGTVKVRVRATGICGSDVPRVLHNGAHFYPIVLGHEFSGEVVEVGEGVENVKPGDTVSGAPLVPCMSPFFAEALDNAVASAESRTFPPAVITLSPVTWT